MATCPKCFTRYPDETVSCDADGQALVPDTAIAALDRDVLAGEMVGEYRVEAKLGEGGFGVVYRAVQPLIGKLVAIKILSRKLSGDPQMVSRFVAEARAVNQIQSKNIVDIFGFGALPDGRQYFVMELLTGLTLEDFVRQRGRVPVEEAMPIFRAIARALDAVENRWMDLLGGPVTMAHIALGVVLGYLDFRHDNRDWRQGRPRLAAWEKAFAARPSMAETLPA